MSSSTIKNKLSKLKQLKNELTNLNDNINKINEKITQIPNYVDIINNMSEMTNIDSSDTNLSEYYNVLETTINDIKIQKYNLENKKYELEEKKQLLESILKKNKTQKCKFNTINDAYEFINTNIIYNDNNDINNDTNNDINNNIKKIIIEDDVTSNASSDLSEREFNLINDIIEKEHRFNMKVFKTYCIFCFYRDILIPEEKEIQSISDTLEGYKYIPMESLNELQNWELIYYLYIDSKSLKIEMGTGYIKKIKGKYITIYNTNLRRDKVLNYLNPIFRKIRMTDIN